MANRTSGTSSATLRTGLHCRKERNILKKRAGEETGVVLVISICFTLLAAIGALAFTRLVRTQMAQVRLQSSRTRAFYTAEVGLEKAMELLKNDLYYTPEGIIPSWADDKVYTATGYIDLTGGGQITVPQYFNFEDPDYDGDFYPLIRETTYLLEGYGGFKSTYQVDISNIQGWTDRIWVKAAGRYYCRSNDGCSFSLQAERKVLALLQAREICVWNNATFAGEGQGGAVINGNATIRGSVHILGTTLGSDDLALDFGGGGSIGNNYAGMPASLAARVPSIQKQYGTETVDSLQGEVRVKRGRLSLSGASCVGEPHVPGNGVKETMDGVYVTDGYAGDASQSVYCDNSPNEPYDLDETPGAFPRLSDPYQEFPTYLDYLRSEALVISDPHQLNQMRDVDPTSVFDYADVNGRVRMDGNGHLTVEGVVVVEGNINFGKKGYQHVIEYTGVGTLVSASSVGINCNLLTRGMSTFPREEILGIVAADTISFEESQINVMGTFYAENEIVVQKQTSIAGTICATYIDMGNNVPSIYQVPQVLNYLPPKIIKGPSFWALKNLTWGEI
jgi:hypothetical protein